jgi:hypothetical protein
MMLPCKAATRGGCASEAHHTGDISPEGTSDKGCEIWLERMSAGEAACPIQGTKEYELQGKRKKSLPPSNQGKIIRPAKSLEQPSMASKEARRLLEMTVGNRELNKVVSPMHATVASIAV